MARAFGARILPPPPETMTLPTRLTMVGFTQYFYIGQRLVVNFTHFAVLWLVEASKCRQHL